MKRKQYAANDQYGHTIYLKTQHPRKELCERHGVRHADIMYCDRSDGGRGDGSAGTYQTGYIVAGHWYTILGLEGTTFARKMGDR